MQALVTVTVSLYWIAKKAFTDDKEGTVMTEYHFPPRLICFFFFILFTAANDKRYLTLYKLVISVTIIIIIINTWYATINGAADENINDVRNLHK